MDKLNPNAFETEILFDDDHSVGVSLSSCCCCCTASTSETTE